MLINFNSLRQLYFSYLPCLPPSQWTPELQYTEVYLHLPQFVADHAVADYNILQHTQVLRLWINWRLLFLPGIEKKNIFTCTAPTQMPHNIIPILCVPVKRSRKYNALIQLIAFVITQRERERKRALPAENALNKLYNEFIIVILYITYYVTTDYMCRGRKMKVVR